jgi:3-deoxy-D-manno-octulosonic-acid transferase
MGPAYRLAARIVHRLPWPSGTLADSLAGRREADLNWTVWAMRNKPDGPLIWAHAASVGEAMTLVPVVTRLRVRTGRLTVILTHTSPSLDGRQVPGFDHIDFLPLDEPGCVAAALSILKPSLLLFGRGDLWPELITQASGTGIPIAVAGAMVRAGSARLRWPARAALARVHRAVTWVGAISPEDAERWRRLGVPAERITVTGDPRHDQVVERIPDLRPARRWRAATGPALTVVAGSTEPDDDEILAEAAANTGDQWRWLVIPHDGSDRRAPEVEAAFRRRGLPVTLWDGRENPNSALVTVVSRPGLLADLYWAGDVAWVGGGGTAGLVHAVCEPAAASLPVLAGPHLGTVRDGTLLAGAGGAAAARDAEALAARLAHWAAAPEARRRAGLAARAALDAGAAGHTAARIRQLLGRQPSQPGGGDPAGRAGRFNSGDTKAMGRSRRERPTIFAGQPREPTSRCRSPGS